MARLEIDWSALEGGATGFPPFEAYASQIDEEVTRVLAEVQAVSRQIESTQKKVLSFSTNSDPEDSFVRHAAMRGVLEHHSLLDAYDDDLAHPKVATLTDTDRGWNLRLNRPKKLGYFLITYSRYKEAAAGIQSVFYGKAN